ncbi:ABC transporter permease [Opitutus terrae]|uniref:Permease n=1 Tax=Opitutus terrae (strain DSM 11246 / JCM 15787 / PB90-1) TaxID=452637 RepID=B1ZX00_OPITP|nr:ABC transporter permease [Opitutus terrae]ACB75111.1 permease [Opitutus terrae PB90-1]
MIADLRFALRQLAKSPAFAVTAILTLALGIGACTAMFSILNAVLLRPLPFREPTRLVWIENVYGGGLSGRTTRVDVFNGWRAQTQTLDALAAYFAFSDYGRHTLTGSGEPERLRGVGVSDNFFPTLGIPLLHGRNFTAEECRWQGPGAVILSHSFWQRRFAGDPAVVGRTVTLNNTPTTIVGVLPPTFDFDAIFTPGNEVEVVTPFPLTDETARWGNTVFGLGRMKPGVTLEQVQAELTVISLRLRESIGRGDQFGAKVSSLDTALRGRFRSAFLLLSGAVACVLAIACVNLSNLLLARINVRRQEFAVRIALGARRRHLIQQALTESLLLAFAGALIGLPCAVVATAALARLQTFGVPLLQDASVDPVALALTLGLTTLAGLACGLLPAVHLSGAQRTELLQHSNQQRSAGRTAAVARNTLVVVEVALACMLLVGAGLLFRSFNALLQVNLGFQPQQAMAWRVDPPRSFANVPEASAYLDGAVRRVAALPGVESVGLSDCLPLGRNRTWGAGAVGIQYPEGKYPIAYPRIVDSGYLPTMKIPLIAGRLFDERDHEKAERTIVINQTLARIAFPDGRDPLGQKLRVGGDGGSTIIGVVGDVRHSSLEQGGGPEMYLCLRQGQDVSAVEMVVRSTRPAAALIPEVRAALASYDPTLPNGEYYALDRLVDNAVAPRRLITRLLGFFSSLALVLAALGLYGVIAYSVVQRTQEIGIRMAIGAQQRDVLGLIFRGGLKLVALGLAIGLVGAFTLTRLLKSLLFGVTAYDPLSFAGNAALLLAVAAAACLIPALRATRVDPVVALRAE